MILSLLKKNFRLLWDKFMFMSLIMCSFFYIGNMFSGGKYDTVGFCLNGPFYSFTCFFYPAIMGVMYYKLFVDDIIKGKIKVDLLLGYTRKQILKAKCITGMLSMLILLVIPFFLVYGALAIIAINNNIYYYVYSIYNFFIAVTLLILCLLLYLYFQIAFFNILLLVTKNLYTCFINVVIAISIFFYLYNTFSKRVLYFSDGLEGVIEILQSIAISLLINIIYYIYSSISFYRYDFS